MTSRLRRRLAVWVGCVWIAATSLTWTAGADELRHSRLHPLDEQAWDLNTARHLLFRAGFGGSAEDVQRLYDLGLAGAVEHLVYFDGQPAVDLPPPVAPKLEISRDELRQMTEQERMAALNRFRRQEREYLNAVRAWWVRRMVITSRPLEEKLTLFWHGHFASDSRTVERPEAMYNQNELFRQHAAGNFGQLVHAIVRDPAMLRYLDNHRNIAGRPNENLARELMELFTMGEGNGYTERDIAEGARALTGNSFERENMRFIFIARQHDRNAKTIFGSTGRWNGNQFVDLILQQPATAQFIATKLFAFFVHDHPSEEVIEELAQLLRDHDYELRPVLVRLFMSAEFYSPGTIGRQIKSPAELVIGTVRTLQINVDPNLLLQAMRSMGQDLMNPPNVRGWEGGAAWINSNALFARHNFVASLFLGSDARSREESRRPGMAPGRSSAGNIDWAARLQSSGSHSAEEIVDYFARLLLARPVTGDRRDDLIASLSELPPHTDWRSERRTVNRQITQLLVLMMTLPEYQLN